MGAWVYANFWVCMYLYGNPLNCIPTSWMLRQMDEERKGGRKGGMERVREKQVCQWGCRRIGEDKQGQTCRAKGEAGSGWDFIYHLLHLFPPDTRKEMIQPAETAEIFYWSQPRNCPTHNPLPSWQRHTQNTIEQETYVILILIQKRIRAIPKMSNILFLVFAKDDVKCQSAVSHRSGVIWDCVCAFISEWFIQSNCQTQRDGF